MKIIDCLVVSLLAIAFYGRAIAADEPAKPEGYHIVKKEVLGGDGSWDYVSIEPETHRAFIARETRVMVVDMPACKLIKEIPDLHGVHGVALVPEFKRGFISNGRDNTIAIFDLNTYEKIGEAKGGAKPDAIVYDAASKRVFAFNNGGTTATAIDAATGNVAGSVELGGAPEFAVSDGKGRMYVNIEDKSEIVAFDTGKLAVLNHWPLAPGTEPTGLAMDLAHRRLFSGCRGSKTMEVMDADSGKIVATLPIGSGVDAAAFDPDSQNAFSSNGDGTLTIVHEDTPDAYRLVQSLKTEPGARTMALDPKTNQLWLVTAATKPAPENEPNKRKKIIVPDTFSVIVVGTK